jgi:hypothetical protein
MATVKTLGKTWWHHSNQEENDLAVLFRFLFFADESQLRRQPIEKAMLSPSLA